MAAKKGATRAPPTSRRKRPAPQKAGENASAQHGPGSVPTESAAHAPDTEPLIVGVGGSAGSLSPLREVLAAIPADCGIAFVVVSHQAPTGHSMLPERLAKFTEMPVRELSKETRPRPAAPTNVRGGAR
jgi:chemotaxis response regulator CheB